MALLQRISSILAEHGSSTQVLERPTPPRLLFPDGVFAALETVPAEKADEAYEAFRANSLTPSIAEHEVREILMHAAPACTPLECVPSFALEYGHESTDIGRMRVFSHYLVHMQLLHETNLREIQRLSRKHVKHVQVMRGCCEVCDQLVGRTYRVSDPPRLPVRGCLRHGGCNCVIVPAIE